MDPSGLGVDHRGEGDQVGAEQLGETAVVEDQPDDGVQVADLLQLLLSGGVLTGSGLLRLRQQLQVIEEELTHLLRGVDIDRIPIHRVVDLLLQSLQRLLHLADRLAEEGLIDTHSRLLHLQQHAHQRHLDVVEERPQVLLLHLWREVVIELERHVGVLRGVGQHFLRIHLTHRPLLPSLPDQLLDRDRAVPQQRLGEIVHPVTRLRIQQVVRQHRIPERRDGVDVVASEELEVKLPIVRHLYLLRVGKKGSKGSQQLLRLLHLLRQGNVPRLMGSDGEGDPDEVILHAVQTVRLGVEGKGLGTGECLEECSHLCLGGDQGVAVLHRRDVPD